MGMGTLAPSLSMPRGFNFVSPVSSSTNSGWKVLTSLNDVKGVPGLYQFPHANRGYLEYIGQSGDIVERLGTHFGQGNIGGNILYKAMNGSNKLTREISETLRIQKIGNGSLQNLANQRYPISQTRSQQLGLNLYP